MSEISSFLEAASAGKSEDGLSFQVDPKRQREVMLDALRDQPEFAMVHFLAAANLAACAQLEVSTVGNGPRLRDVLRRPSLTIRLPGLVLGPEDLESLPDQMFHAESRLLLRLSLAINQLGAGPFSRLTVESVQSSGCFRLSWDKKQVSRVEELKNQSWGDFQGLIVRTGSGSWWTKKTSFGKYVLGWSALFSPLPVLWDGERLPTSGFSFLRNACDDYLVFSHPKYPLPTIAESRASPGAYSAQLYRGAARVGTISVLVFCDAVPLDWLEVEADDFEDYLEHGLLLLLSSDAYQIDGSGKRLVRNERFFGLLKEVLEAAGPEFFDQNASYSKSKAADFFSFRSGYQFQELVETFLPEENLLAFASPYHWTVISKDSTNPPYHRAYRNAIIEAILKHPGSSQLILILSDGLIVEELERAEGESAVCLSLPGIVTAHFNREGSVLFVLCREPGLQKLMSFCTETWDARDSEQALPPAKVFFLGDWLLLVPRVTTNAELRHLSRLAERVSLPLEESVSSLDLSPDGTKALLNGSLLLELSSGRLTRLEMGGQCFSWDSQWIFWSDPFISHRGGKHIEKFGAYSIKDCQTLKRAEVRTKLGSHTAVDRNGIVRAILHRSWFMLTDWRLKEMVLGKAYDIEVLHEFLPRDRQSKKSFYVSCHVGFRAEGYGACLRSAEVYFGSEKQEFTWTALYSLSPERLMWQAKAGVFVVCRQSGQVKLLPELILVGALVLKLNAKATCQLLDLESGEFGQKVKVSEGQFYNSLINCCTDNLFYRRFQEINVGSRLLVDCQSLAILGQEKCDRIQCNGRFLVKSFPTGMGKDRVYVQSLDAKSSWRHLAWVAPGSATLHPLEDWVVFQQDGQLKKRCLETKKILVSTRGLSCARFKHQWSPNGKFLLLVSESEVRILESEGLSCLAILQQSLGLDLAARELASALQRLREPIGAAWVTDSVVRVESNFWITDNDWSEMTRRPVPSEDGLFGCGQGEVGLRLRAGLCDIYHWRREEILATLHTSEEAWFVFTEDGRWDASEIESYQVHARPDPDLRVPGLLALALRDEIPVPGT